MPRYPLKKDHKPSVPVLNPMTSVVQEINGGKSKVKSKAKRAKELATPQLQMVTSVNEMLPDTEDVVPTNTLNDTKISKLDLEKPSSYNRSMAKPKQLLLDPSELKSISKLQNWCPSNRTPAEDGKTENKILTKFASQKEFRDDSKSNPQRFKLTQYKSVVWNPPLRRNSSATETSETPAKRAKIFETDKPSHIPKKNYEESFVSAVVSDDNKCHSLKQRQEQSGSEKALVLPKLGDLEDKIQDEYPQKISFNEQSGRSQQSVECKIFSQDTLENNANVLSYSPIETANNQQVLGDPLKKILTENLNKECSQSSEEDMFLSQDPLEEKMCAKFQINDPLDDGLASKVKDDFGENLKAEENMETKRANSAESKTVNHTQELSDQDMFESENHSKDPFKKSCITNKAKLHSVSQNERSDGSICIEEVKKDKEIIGEEVFHSIEDQIPPINFESSQLNPGLILSPSINADVTKTPPNHLELDIYSCPTVKRIYSEIPDAVLSEQFVVDQLSENPEQLNLPCAIDSIDIANHLVQENENHLSLLNNGKNSYDNVQSQDGNIIANSVEIVKTNCNTEAQEITNNVLEEVALDVGDKDQADFNVGNHGFPDGEQAKSEKLANVPSDKENDVLMRCNEVTIICKDSIVQEDKSRFQDLQIAENNSVDTEELHLEEDTESIKCSNKIDAYVSVVNQNDLPIKVEISGLIEKAVCEDQKQPHDFPQNDVTNEHVLEVRDPNLIAENTIPRAEISTKLIENKEVLLGEVIGNLSQKAVQKGDKGNISQAAEMESKQPIPNDKVYTMEVASSKTTATDDDNDDERSKMKPYTYEIEQDFDITQSQLIEIESAIMRECRMPGSAANNVLTGGMPKEARGMPRETRGMPREAATFPGTLPEMCAEARMAGFSMPHLPPVPALNWKRKVQEDRQKLRTAIHEISRLNAMLMSVRREVWPTPPVNPEHPALSDINWQGPGTSARRY